jgi:hypothetical protein
MTDYVAERFWAKVEKTEGGCWLWTASRHPKGYGLLSFGNRPARAHRVAWQLTNGDIPPGLFVCHRCDNPPCCNPEHLFLGTNTDNMRDASQKGRLSGGPGQPKLTAEQVIGARQRHPGVCYSALAKEFGVTFECIKNAVRGFTWASLNHLEPPGLGGIGGANSVGPGAPSDPPPDPSSGTA